MKESLDRRSLSGTTLAHSLCRARIIEGIVRIWGVSPISGPQLISSLEPISSLEIGAFGVDQTKDFTAIGRVFRELGLFSAMEGRHVGDLPSQKIQ